MQRLPRDVLLAYFLPCFALEELAPLLLTSKWMRALADTRFTWQNRLMMVRYERARGMLEVLEDTFATRRWDHEYGRLARHGLSPNPYREIIIDGCAVRSIYSTNWARDGYRIVVDDLWRGGCGHVIEVLGEDICNVIFMQSARCFLRIYPLYGIYSIEWDRANTLFSPNIKVMITFAAPWTPKRIRALCAKYERWRQAKEAREVAPHT